MKHLTSTLILFGFFLCPIHSRAEPFELAYSIVSSNQKANQGRRSIKRPLVVDLVGNTLTVPSSVIGYTLTIEKGEEVYTYYIIDTTLEIPQELSGNYQITISDGNSIYHGIIEL